jgi:hypothetical protein
VLVSNFSTLNAAIAAGEPGAGRVYAICIGDSAEDVQHISEAAGRALREMVTPP